MNAAKEEMLTRIRLALKDVPGDEDPDTSAISHSYRTSTNAPQENLWLFAERVGDYKAEVTKVSPDEVPTIIRDHLKQHNVKKLVVPDGTSEEWLPEDVELLRDKKDNPLTYSQLDESDGVLTGCAMAVAQTGSIVLDSGKGQGRRVLTLLPDYHLCVVFEDQIVGIVPEAFEKLNDKMMADGPPVTFISGPSATSDIELNRVEGVHGPRQLDVIIVARGG